MPIATLQRRLRDENTGSEITLRSPERAVACSDFDWCKERPLSPREAALIARIDRARLDHPDDEAGALLAFCGPPKPGDIDLDFSNGVLLSPSAEAERARMRQRPPEQPAWWTTDRAVTPTDWTNAHESSPAFHAYAHAYARQPSNWSYLGPRVWRTALERNQWPWYPQRLVYGQRKPCGATAKVDPTGADKRLGISPRWLSEAAASPDRTWDWVETLHQRRHHDVQVALPLGGPASMYMAAEDGDVDDPAIVERIDRVRAQHLPETPYVRMRHGSVRTARLYRQDPADPWGRIPPLTFRLPTGVDPDAKPAPHRDAVEFLSRAGQSLTILGRHYKTKDALQWKGLHPGLDEGATPFRAPIVSSARMQAYVAALRAEFGDDLEPEGKGPTRGSGEVREYDGAEVDLAGLRLPADPRYHGAYTYGDDGRVMAGREGWVFAHCGYVSCLATNLRASPDALATLVADDLPNHVHIAGWSDVDGGVRPYILDKMRRAVAYRDSRVRDHGFEGYRVARVGDVEVAPAESDYESDEYEDPDIRALVPRQASSSNRRHRTPRDPKRAADRALLDDRSALTAGVATTIKGTIRRHLDNVAGVQGLLDAPAPQRDRLRARRDAAAAHDAEADRLRGERAALIDAATPSDDPAVRDLDARIRAAGWAARTAAAAVTGNGTDWRVLARTVLVMKGPTGSGKTTTALNELLAMKARLAAQGRRLGTQLFFAPSHALLGEVAAKASALTTDQVVVSHEEAQALIDAAREAAKLGLRVRIYRGRGEVCTHPAWPTLRKAGISGQKLCKSTRRVLVDGEWTDEPVECDAYKDKSCVVWSQRLGLADIDILFMPSAYLVLPIPEEVRAVATGVIADESVTNQFLGYAMMPIATLKSERRIPRINKREQEAGITEGHLIGDRREIADIVKPIVERGDDLAAGLLAHDWGRPTLKAYAYLIQLLDSAVNTCGRAMDVHEEVDPSMTAKAAGGLAALRALDEHLAEEKRFWSTIRERVKALINDRALGGMASTPALKAVADKLRTAKGYRDARIQTLNHEGEVPTVRISFRRRNSFADLPTLLMDASADRGMIEKIYQGRPVEVVTADCPPHLRVLLVADRTMSDTSLLPYKDRAPFAAAQTLVDVHTVLDGMATLFGHSQVAVASTLQVEMAANTAWRAPSNVSWLHYNNVVGFDWAKHHPAMLVVGRQELPIPVIDAYVGALTFDDDTPELPIDRLGTGLTAKGDRVRAIVTQRQQPMRDGSDLTLDDWTYTGAWARAVQAQAREEQVRQAIGRLRPVYRPGEAPLLAYVGRALPSDIVVDAVASLSDIVQSDACKLGRDLRAGGMVRYRSDLNGATPTSAGPIPKADEGAHIQEIREGRHHAQRGLATVEVTLTDGRTIEGFVPMADMSPEELRRRVDRHLGLCAPVLYRKPGSEVRVTHVPERDTQAIVRGDDPKMVLRLGDRAARQVAEDAAEDLAIRVCQEMQILHGEAVATAKRARTASPVKGPEVLASASAMAAALTVRKRAPGECASNLATLVNPILLPVLVPALARVYARDVVDESEPEEIEPVIVVNEAAALDAIYDEAAELWVAA